MCVNFQKNKIKINHVYHQRIAKAKGKASCLTKKKKKSPIVPTDRQHMVPWWNISFFFCDLSNNKFIINIYD